MRDKKSQWASGLSGPASFRTKLGNSPNTGATRVFAEAVIFGPGHRTQRWFAEVPCKELWRSELAHTAASSCACARRPPKLRTKFAETMVFVSKPPKKTSAPDPCKMQSQRSKHLFCLLFACVYSLAWFFLTHAVAAINLRKSSSTQDLMSSEQLLEAIDAKIASLKIDIHAMMEEKLTASNTRNDKQMETAVQKIKTKIETAVAKAVEGGPAVVAGGGTVADARSSANPGETNQAVSDRNMSVVLRTWYKDVPTAMPGLESAIRLIGNQLLEIVVVTDEESAETVRSLLVQKLVEKYPALQQRDGIRMHVEPMMLADGHIQQKYSKMTADTYTKGDLIFHLDSDCVLTQWNSECYLEEGKPVNDFATFDSIDKIVERWKNGTEIVLGIPEELYEFSRLNQHVYPRQLYSILRRRVEEVHGVPFEEVFHKLNLAGKHSLESNLLVSDFNLLGATSFHFAPDLMFQKNLTNGASPWRPICVAQCNVRASGAKCCEAWLNEQVAVANNGGQPSAHMTCEPGDFPSNHPCHCGD